MTVTVGDLLVKIVRDRDDAIRTVDPTERQRKALVALQEAMFAMHKLLGNELLVAALGTVDASDRAQVLETAARRIHMLSAVFGDLPEDAASPVNVVEEAVSIAKGDAPLMFARLDGRKVNDRIIRAKFEALKWEAYLKGFGIRAGERHERIALAFGADWETIRRAWRRDVASTLEPAQVRYLLAVAEVEGRGRVPRWEMKDDDWASALTIDGARCVQAIRENNGNW